MQTVTVSYARIHFSRLMAAAEAGEEIIIVRRDKVAVRMEPLVAACADANHELGAVG